MLRDERSPIEEKWTSKSASKSAKERSRSLSEVMPAKCGKEAMKAKGWRKGMSQFLRVLNDAYHGFDISVLDEVFPVITFIQTKQFSCVVCLL